jgi:tripartite-type tricarboxylate transporter receptor subunit TctC
MISRFAYRASAQSYLSAVAIMCAAISLSTASSAAALDYPARPVRVIAANAAGSTVDFLARLMAQWLSERLGQQFLVENRSGAGGNIGTESVVRAPPDGYTLLLVTTSNMINASLYERLNYNFIRDIAPVAAIGRGTLVMEVNPAVPAQSVAQFIAYAKANPGRINMASGGNGTSTHVSGELFKMMAGVNMVHVPYRGVSQAITDLIGGQVQVMFDTTAASIGYIRAGQLRPLAVTTAVRSPALPGIPTVAEFVPGYEASALNGIGAPRGTPAEIVDLLNREINAGLADPKLQARFDDLGVMVLKGSPADFAMLIAAETDKWAKVVRFIGARAE